MDVLNGFTALQLRKAWHDRMLLEWEKNIQSETTDGRKAITGYFDACGWKAWLRSQPGCSGGYVRRKGSGVDYCGQVLGAMGLELGQCLVENACVDIRLAYPWAHFLLPSTARMTSADTAKRAGVKLIKPLPKADVQPFDIITVTTGADKPYGDHFCIVHTVGPDHVVTLEGNATGMNVLGIRVHGVVMGKRALKDIRRVYRFELDAFEASDTATRQDGTDCAGGLCGSLFS